MASNERRSKFVAMAGRYGLMILIGFWVAAPLQANEVGDPLEAGLEAFRDNRFDIALRSLQDARGKAVTPAETARADGALGLAHYQLHHDLEAERFLREAVKLAGDGRVEAVRWKATLASLLLNRGDRDAAAQLYAEALSQAGTDAALRASIALGQSRLLADADFLGAASKLHEQFRELPASNQRSALLIHLASRLRRFGRPGHPVAYAALTDARQGVQERARLHIEILDELAQLYEDQGRDAEAAQLNRQAAQFARSAEAADLLVDLEWRQGRLHLRQGQVPEAMAAYQRAFDAVEVIRRDIPLTYHDGRSSFRDTLEPLYLQYADLLLKEAARQTDPPANLALLRRARQTVELIKQSEFEDFLGGRCAVQPKPATIIDTVEAQTAVLYPVILSDRLEVLISIGGEIRRFSHAVAETELRDTVRRFAGALRGNQRDAKDFAAKLYGWLLAPAHPWLDAQQVKTLVVIPDGVMRLIPIGALFDGRQYVVERYAVSTSPGLTVVAPSGLPSRGAVTLLAGISEPGSVISRLPDPFIDALDIDGTRGFRSGMPNGERLLPVNADEDAAARSLRRERLLDPAYQSRLREELRLPGVMDEVAGLKPLGAETVLLNERFTAENFRERLMSGDYSVVHIASHGVFGSSASTSFIMAYDDIITLDQLETWLRSGKFARNPIELLTLSACQTAEGDDRAPLGLSGIALKGNVRSAVGTLWPVNDKATARLMARFYSALKVSGTSRAQALREAQRSLLTDGETAHPYYWAPFILVGNWL